MTLVQKLRAQLERVAMDPEEQWCGATLDDDAFWFASGFELPFAEEPLCQSERISILSAAIRAAVVTRWGDGSRT